MNKNKFVLLSLLITISIFYGCQKSINIQQDVKNEIEKTKQARQEAVKSQDLSNISGDAKIISKKISDNKKSKDTSSERNDLANNNENEISNKEQVDIDANNDLPIDMELVKNCKKVVLETNMGNIEVEFFGDKAPTTVANFCTLAKKGFYDKLIFHRIIKDFMIQGGDPKGNGSGDAGYKFKDEIYEGNSNDEYTISMANAGPNTNGSQFFINTKANNFLDTKHTVFGKITKGQDVIDKMEQVETGGKDKPVEDVVIIKAVISE